MVSYLLFKSYLARFKSIGLYVSIALNIGQTLASYVLSIYYTLLSSGYPFLLDSLFVFCWTFNRFSRVFV